MIRYISRHKLDVEKYDLCVENAINSRIYVFSWYLDIVADNWDALILNDYEAVMPLPWRSKYFIKYVYPPVWTQQLGVFSVNAINEPLVRDFIKAIPRKFKKITIQFNSGNPIRGKNVTEKVNYILPLDKTYEELFKAYRKDRKERIRKNIDRTIYSDSFKFLDVIKLSEKYYSGKFKLSNKSILYISKLVKTLNERGFLNVKVDIETKTNEIIAGAIFVKYNNQIVYLFSSQSDKGRDKNSLSIVINKIIEENSNSTYLLDFEGSMIPTIADFFKSFGAEQEIYYLYQTNFKLF